MSNQEKTYVPPPIKGYRNLTQAEVDLMNRCKAKAEEVRELVDAVLRDADPDCRWLGIAEQDLQKGFMCLIRSIAKPTTY